MAEIYQGTPIDVVLDPATAAGKRSYVVVEVTPRLREDREELETQGVDWTTAGLRRGLMGKWVEFEGLLFFDAEHTGQAQNTHPKDPNAATGDALVGNSIW